MKNLNRRSFVSLMSASFVGWALLPKIAFASEQTKLVELLNNLEGKKVLKGYYADPAKIRELGLTEHKMVISNSDAARIQQFQLSPEWLDQNNYHALNRKYKTCGKIVSQKTEVVAGNLVIKTKFDSPESMIEYYLNFSTTPGFFDSGKFLSQGYQVTRTWS